MSKLAENIKAYRKKQGISQTEFASKLHVTKQAVSKWETGRGYPDSAIIPEIAKVMDISIDTLMGESRISKKVIVIIVTLVILAVLAVFITPMISRSLRSVSAFNEYKDRIEDTTNLDLPNKGSLVSADLEEWRHFGNATFVDQMSYMVFNDNNQTSEFETGISGSDKWIVSLNQTQIDSLPSNISSYTTVGDYFALYNVDNDTYNEIPSEIGTYEYMFLIYQVEHHRLIVFDYSLEIKEGD